MLYLPTFHHLHLQCRRPISMLTNKLSILFDWQFLSYMKIRHCQRNCVGTLWFEKQIQLAVSTLLLIRFNFKNVLKTISCITSQYFFSVFTFLIFVNIYIFSVFLFVITLRIDFVMYSSVQFISIHTLLKMNIWIQLIRNNSLNIMRWSNGRDQIQHKARHSLLDLVTPTVFDHLIVLKEWFFIP